MLGIKALLAVVATCPLTHATPQDVYHGNVVQSDTAFYGQSSPVYPTPEITGTGDWDESFSKARDMVGMMTLVEKVSLTGGYENNTSSCSGKVRAINRLGFSGMCLQDGPAGVKGAEGVNGYPAGLHIGASWNKTNAYERARVMAGEFKRKGATLSLGPAVLGPLGKIPHGGRNWEGFAVDPYLSGILGAESVRATQDEGIISCTKHFVGNEQETHRFQNIDRTNNHTIEALSSNIDDKTMHELYMWAFADAIHAGTASIMCSYQRVNNSYACHNSKAMNGLLKTELGFQGFVLSDWEAQKAGVASALAGLDMTMPDGETYWGSRLVQAVHNGSIPESHIDDMATRIIAAWYYSQQDDAGLPPVGAGFPADLLAPHEFVNARDPDDAAILLDAAIEGHVLVKNDRQALPLSKPQVLAIYGYDARTPGRNNPENGFSDWMLGFEAHDYQQVNCGDFGTNLGPCPPYFTPFANGTLMGGGGSGAIAPFYVDSPLEALQARARRENTQLFWDVETRNSNSTIPGAADACLVFINSFSSEARDRLTLRDDFSDALVLNIAAQCDNTIVVVHTAGIRLVDQWIEHPNVSAAIIAHLPGQDSGEAITRILYGDVSPSGKLTYTIARNESDYGALLKPATSSGWDRYFPQDNFTEGPYIDYRAFDRHGIQPRFEFGFGLAYTTFEYSNLEIRTVNASNLSAFPVGPIIPGGHADLWDTVAVVTSDVTNTGDIEAAEVAQLYLGIPGEGQPPRQLRGFDKAVLRPGETRTFEFEFRRRDLSVWDVAAQQWRLLTGSKYRVFVGASSRHLNLNGTLVL